jgi:hypothetical protein
MIRHLVIQTKPAKPAVRQIEMRLLAQAPLGLDAHDIASHQNAHDEFGINRGATGVAVERLKPFPHDGHVEETIDLSKDMVGWHMCVQIELIKQLRFDLLNSHHRSILPISINRVNQTTCRTATQSFSTALAETSRSLQRQACEAPNVEVDIGLTASWVKFLNVTSAL